MSHWQTFHDESLRWLDLALGGLLRLPRDAALVLVALLTVSFLVLVRRFATNQELLRRCAADWRRLKERRREAKQARDRDALVRLGRTMNQIRLVYGIADLQVLAWAILPLGFLGLWASARLEYLPARIDDRVEVTAYFASSSVGRIAHLVPRSDLECESPVVQSVALLDPAAGLGVVRWVVRPKRWTQDFELTIRHAGESVNHPMRIGGTRYEPPVVRYPQHARLLRTEVTLKPYRFLGIDPRLEPLGIPSWLVAYLLLSLALYPALRRLTRTA